MVDLSTLDSRTATLEAEPKLAGLMRAAQFDTRCYLTDLRRAGKSSNYSFPELAWSSFLKRAESEGLTDRVVELVGPEAALEY